MGRPQADNGAKANPFSREGMAAKRAALMDAMRADRNLADPAKAPSEDKAPEPAKEAKTDATASPGSARGDLDKSAPTASPNASDPSSPLHAEWLRREQEIKTAEARVKEARSTAEQRSAKAEADEAKAKQALTELAAAKDDPVEFLAKVGMTKDEWQHFMSQGGKQSPEAKRLKAMEARFNEMEAKYETAQKKAEESARRASIETENMQFSQRLGSYALLSKIGGIQAVRNKQAQIQAQQGAQISLQAAADMVETEMHDNLLPLLKHEDVRRKLGLLNPDQPSGQGEKKPAAVNGAGSAKPTPPADPEEEPAPWDWAAKKRLARKRMDLERKKRSAL